MFLESKLEEEKRERHRLQLVNRVLKAHVNKLQTMLAPGIKRVSSFEPGSPEGELSINNPNETLKPHSQIVFPKENRLSRKEKEKSSSDNDYKYGPTLVDQKLHRDLDGYTFLILDFKIKRKSRFRGKKLLKIIQSPKGEFEKKKILLKFL